VHLPAGKGRFVAFLESENKRAKNQDPRLKKLEVGSTKVEKEMEYGIWINRAEVKEKRNKIFVHLPAGKGRFVAFLESENKRAK